MSQELIKAVSQNQKRTVVKLLMSGVNPNYTEDACAVTPLHIAAQNNSLEIITALVFAGADMLAVTIDGYTPLNIAKMHKQKAAEDLLKKLMILNLQEQSKTKH